MTATRSETCFTTERSCAMNRYVRLNSSWRSSSRFSTWAWIETSSAETGSSQTVSYTHLRAHETPEHLVCRLLLEKKKQRLNGPRAKKIIGKKRWSEFNIRKGRSWLE